jgi:hypothetical protein
VGPGNKARLGCWLVIASMTVLCCLKAVSGCFWVYSTIVDELLAGKTALCAAITGEAVPVPGAVLESSYLVDPASSHMLVSKIKPCMSKYKQICTVKLRMAH